MSCGPGRGACASAERRRRRERRTLETRRPPRAPRGRASRTHGRDPLLPLEVAGLTLVTGSPRPRPRPPRAESPLLEARFRSTGLPLQPPPRGTLPPLRAAPASSLRARGARATRVVPRHRSSAAAVPPRPPGPSVPTASGPRSRRWTGEAKPAERAGVGTVVAASLVSHAGARGAAARVSVVGGGGSNRRRRGRRSAATRGRRAARLGPAGSRAAPFRPTCAPWTLGAPLVRAAAGRVPAREGPLKERPKSRRPRSQTLRHRGGRATRAEG